MFQSQQGRGYWRGKWRPPNPRKSPHTHRARGPEGTFHERDPLFDVRGQSSFTQRGQGRDQSRRGRGRVGQGHDGTHEHPVYLADKINEICRSFDDLDLGDKEEIAGPNKVAKGSQEGLAVTLIEDIIREEWDQPNARQRESIKVLVQ